MKKIISIIIIVFFLLNMFGQTSISQGNSSTNANWMIMIYLNGDNLLYQVQELELEKIRVVGSTEQVNIAILHDSNQQGDTKLYYLEGTDLIEQEWETESNMADPNTLRDFVQKVKTDHSFEHDALIISTNKGSGWQGILWDDTNGNNRQITMPEFTTAFSDITNSGTDTLDVLAIETCMGSMTENAYQFKDYANYYIAYEDCAMAGYEPYSWPFEGPITDLTNNPDMSPEEFSVSHLNYFEPKKFTMNRITTVLTVTQLNQIESVKNAVDSLAQYFIDHIDDYRDEIKNAIDETRLLGELWYIEFYFDPVHFLNLLTIEDAEFTSIKDTAIDAYESAVIACDHLDNDPVCGLSLYFPRIKADYDHSFRFDTLLSSYEDTEFAKDTNWEEFLKSFLEIEENTAPNTPNIEGANRGEPETEYEFIISADDAENDELYYFIDWGDETSSGWIGPLASGEEITQEHIWSEEGTFTVRVKAKDSDESEWGTLQVRMPKNKFIQRLSNSWEFLFGFISDIETDTQNRFRFLPIFVFCIGNTVEEGFSMTIRNQADGPYPCCGYIDPNEFIGIIQSNFISGLWAI
ncbi:clostripain-related cysteine peptidase [Pseudomonadota bacterium]